MIVAGRVQVNGVVVTKLGTQADPDRDKILVDGKPIRIEEKKVYYLFHKPKNIMVTRKDPEGRPTVFDYLKEIPQRVNTVGRLDFDSEGLILLTNDGELQARLTHPRHEVEKVYEVKLAKEPLPHEIEALRAGVDIGGYVTQRCGIRVLKKSPGDFWIQMVLREGKNRQIRRMVESVGHEVVRLIRTGIGLIRLGDLQRGRWRPLTLKEIQLLAHQKNQRTHILLRSPKPEAQ